MGATYFFDPGIDDPMMGVLARTVACSSRTAIPVAASQQTTVREALVHWPQKASFFRACSEIDRFCAAFDRGRGITGPSAFWFRRFELLCRLGGGALWLV